MDCVSTRLAAECSTCKYEFPARMLSPQTQPEQYVGISDQKTAVLLNSFEYFMFAFISYPLNNKWKKTLILSEFEESVYIALFNDYMAFYLYTDTTAMNILISHVQPNKVNPQMSINQRSYFNESSPYVIDNPDFYHYCMDHGIFWQTETVFQAVLEFLLSWRSDFQSQPSNNAGGVSSLMEVPSAPQSYLEMSFRPSSCHMYLIRTFLKYFYHIAFNHTIPTSVQGPYQQMLWMKVLSYRKYLCNSICLPPNESTNIHSSLMMHLKQLIVFCFQHWPLDLSFEIVVETWLTSMQPWRYSETPQPQGSSVSISPTASPKLGLPHMDADSPDVQPWIAFAIQQYSLYVVPLLLFLQRAVRMDLLVNRNAYMVYRVAKVFSQSNLKSVLMSAEDALSHQTGAGQTRMSYLNLTESTPPVEQTGLWSPTFLDVVNNLLEVLSSTRLQLCVKARRSVNPENEGIWRRSVNYLTELLFEDTANEIAAAKKCDRNLRDAALMFRTFFNLPEDTAPWTQPCPSACLSTGRLELDDTAESPLVALGRGRDRTNTQTPPRRVQFALDTPSTFGTISNSNYSASGSLLHGESPAHLPRRNEDSSSHVTERKRQITPLERFQILMGERRPDIRLKRNPDHLPACTYEIPALVDLSRYVSGLINTKMRTKFLHWCADPGVCGWIARHCLLTSGSSKDDYFSPDNSHSLNALKDSDPKISLRWLASYALLFRLGILYALAFLLLGVRSPLLFVFFVLLLFFFHQLIKLCFIFVRDTVRGCHCY
ncbi:unnamed protein product [Calicophoron daubneyi]|uniref:Sphingomyelin phosphodiesterase 4 n=1 Tax=Calicophoron daubneyi TaxID=300641 RepID=A0AAV2TK81_CALDB